MPRVVTLWLVASALLLSSNSGDAQIQRQPMQPPAPLARCATQQAGAHPCLVYEQGTDLTLTAGGQFTKWMAGPCNGQTTPTCRFTVGIDTVVSALYTRQ